MHFPLFLPPKRGTAVLRTLKYKQSTLLLAVSLCFCLHYQGLVFMLFIKKKKSLPFHCLVCISCFLLSRVSHLALEIFCNDGFTEGPANRALTTASPLVTACQPPPPRGMRPLGSTWLVVFFLYSPRALFRHGYIT